MRINLTYCYMWNYEPKAVSLTSKLITELKEKVKELKLIPGTGGAFEIEVNGDLIYSKLKTGQFPDENWVLDTVRKKAG